MSTTKDEGLMFKSSRKYMPTLILIAINIAVYAWTAYLSQNLIDINDTVLELYGQWNRQVLYGGAYWQLFTSMFVHVNIVHIAGNMLFLLIFGLRAEDMFSVEEYLGIYILSGLAGNAFSLLLGLDMISAGASGAIFGMFGAVTIYVRRSVGQSIITALMFAFFLLLVNIGPGVNVLAHLGGLVIGLLMGYAFAVTRRKAVTYQYRYSYSV